MEPALSNNGHQQFADLCEAFLLAVGQPRHRRFPSRLLEIASDFLAASSIVVLQSGIDQRLHLVDAWGRIPPNPEDWSVVSEDALSHRLPQLLHPRSGERLAQAPLMRDGVPFGIFAATVPAVRPAMEVHTAASLWSLSSAPEPAVTGAADPDDDRLRQESRLHGWAEISRGLHSHVSQIADLSESSIDLLVRSHESLADSPLVQALRHANGQCRRLATRLRDLNRLLDTPPNFRPVSMTALMRLAVRRARGLHGSVRFRTVAPTTAATGLTVLADPEQVLHALSEILHNAVEYGDGRPVLVQLSHRAGIATLAVRSESSMSTLTQNHAFELFYSSQKDPNRGLGLPIARAIAVLHRGSLRCSTSERATTFYFNLPLMRS